MGTFSLNPDGLVVESFPTVETGPAVAAGPMKTFEPGCTTPELCPVGAAIGITEPVPTTMRTFERDCTYPDLCGGTN